MRQMCIAILFSVWLFGCAAEEAKIIQKGAIPHPGEKLTIEKEAIKSYISMADIKINPFLTSEEEEYFRQSQKQEIIDDFHLAAILYSPLRRRAIIDGRILGEGDSIDSKRIVQILKESVILKDEEGEYVLKLGEVSP